MTATTVTRVRPGAPTLCGCWPRRVLAGGNTPEGVQRCDDCSPAWFGDLDAAAVLALYVGGVVRFYVEGEHPPGVCALCVDDPNDPGRCDGRWDRLVAVTLQGPNDDRVIASGTDPWVEIDGSPVEWTTTAR